MCNGFLGPATERTHEVHFQKVAVRLRPSDGLLGSTPLGQKTCYPVTAICASGQNHVILNQDNFDNAGFGLQALSRQLEEGFSTQFQTFGLEPSINFNFVQLIALCDLLSVDGLLRGLVVAFLAVAVPSNSGFRTAIIQMLVFHRSRSALPVHGGPLRGANSAPGEYKNSTALKDWVRKNKNNKYVPSELLLVWGFKVDTGACSQAGPHRPSC